MRPKINIALLVSCLLAPIAITANPVNNTNVINQLSAPAYWQFNYDIRTIGQAINQVLSATKLKVSPTLSPSIADILKQSLPEHLRVLDAMSVFQAIKQLTGSQIFVITPELNEISFSFDKNLSETNLQIQTVQSPLQKYLDRTNFTIRISQPLTELGLKPIRDEVIAFNKQQALYFGFNDQEQIVAIAQSQKEANYLAKKDIEVFFAKQGDTLKQTITNWAKIAGFKAYYLAKKDLVIDISNAFYGSFTSDEGALAQLIESALHAGLDIKAEFNANNVVVIKDNSYSPILLSGDNNV
ncbi:TcpQ domain-containing protein [Francisella sp. TX07-6608]|uniref:TcpQ domain-containing protein n=1 Tax=Francisella sp. TX07-6608 TaxID=573568 RepID=UPI0008F9919A|nr:TcpQ domain-containing protein [Francisella sp. TX07-6608]OIN82935.1 toxin co-regulated pilus biosynthesis Q family protein [Francisella sp. TX07-6608]